MGLLDASVQQPQTGGLLGAQAPPQAPQMTPELTQLVAQIKGAPQEQQQVMISKVMEVIKNSPKDPAMKDQALQQFMQAMGGGQQQAQPAPQQPMFGGA